VHEFVHSFVNPAIDKVPKDLIQSTEYLFLPIKDEMAKQSYLNWTVCLYEHFVRAGEVVIARKLGNFKDADRTLQENTRKSFIYLPIIVTELEYYAKNKNTFKSYDDFVPSVIEKLKTNTKH
jgi:Domain of unknown function (DUF4932)